MEDYQVIGLDYTLLEFDVSKKRSPYTYGKDLGPRFEYKTRSNGKLSQAIPFCSPFTTDQNRLCVTKQFFPNGCSCKRIGKDRYRLSANFSVTAKEMSHGMLSLIWPGGRGAFRHDYDLPEVRSRPTRSASRLRKAVIDLETIKMYLLVIIQTLSLVITGCFLKFCVSAGLRYVFLNKFSSLSRWLDPNNHNKVYTSRYQGLDLAVKATMKILGIELAPLNIPLERRLQTIGALHFTYSFLFFGFGMLFFFLYLFFFTSYYFIPLLYLIWYLYDSPVSRHGGRRSDWVRRWPLFRWSAAYFPLELIKTSELHPSKNYIFACHPHGVMCQSHFINFASEGTGFSDKFPGIKPYLTVLAGQFMFPIFRDYFLLSGAVEVSGSSIDWVLTKEGCGNAVAIMVGGAKEALDAHPGSLTLNIKGRKGFCKKALMHGASLVPVYAFGENDLFDQVPNQQGSKVRRLQNFMTHLLGFSPALFHGRGIFNYTFGLLPYRKPVHTVIGAPLAVEKVESPSSEQIEDLHSRYCEALVQLFEDHKLKYGLTEADHLDLH
ncbi:2-acylglycerol o-acyltransferase 2 [Plakobranchus ocellatus]|uniref:diacylglycerol O-acyltransferase n=1 Tax=Plakobranchus ocellatus TaxID=259542 RepID=A0AAV3Z3L1_9GAST|nr:2-acylglycerol o-acyltransferase 2 [Plakobranchus ocellatus]